MKPAPIPANETERQAAVQALGVVDTPPEERFDRITRAAAVALNVPISTISIVDRGREWFKSSVGVSGHEGPRESSFCGHTIVQGKMFIVEDTPRNPDFADNPQVVNPPHIRFYAGITLHDRRSHQPVGVFCIKDTRPRKLSMTELTMLMEHADDAERELNQSNASTR